MPSNWIERFADPGRRLNFLRQRTAAHIAMQLRALREDREWSQADLATKSGIKQSALSRCEKIGYGKYTISTLLKLAEAFDVALDVSFVSYGELWRRERKLANEPLVPKGFAAEQRDHQQRRESNVVNLATWAQAHDVEWTITARPYENADEQRDARHDAQLDLIPGYLAKPEVTIGGTYSVSYTA